MWSFKNESDFYVIPSGMIYFTLFTFTQCLSGDIEVDTIHCPTISVGMIFLCSSLIPIDSPMALQSSSATKRWVIFMFVFLIASGIKRVGTWSTKNIPSPYARTHRASCRLCKGRNVPNFYRLCKGRDVANFYRLCKGRNVPNSDKKGGKKYPPFVFFHIQSDQFSALS